MLDDIISENLRIIIESLELIEDRFGRIDLANDFVSNANGILILDAVSMRLQIIGELLKKIDKIDSTHFYKYPEVEWDKIMRLRDIISHHYEMIDHEIIYDICRNHIPKLKAAVQKIVDDDQTK
jgi:uncharacterized protein with HEPN domain